MLTDLEYKILQFVRDGLYGRPISKREIINTLGDRLYARDGNQYAQINKTVDSLIARQFLERKVINNREGITLTPKGEQAWHAWFYKDDNNQNITEKKSLFYKTECIKVGKVIFKYAIEIIVGLIICYIAFIKGWQ